MVYHLHSLGSNPQVKAESRRLRVKCQLSGTNPEIDSVSSVWRAANWYEREMFDMFGIGFRNHPNLDAHSDAARLGRLSAAQRLSGARLQVQLREGIGGIP